MRLFLATLVVIFANVSFADLMAPDQSSCFKKSAGDSCSMDNINDGVCTIVKNGACKTRPSNKGHLTTTCYDELLCREAAAGAKAPSGLLNKNDGEQPSTNDSKERLNEDGNKHLSVDARDTQLDGKENEQLGCSSANGVIPFVSFAAGLTVLFFLRRLKSRQKGY
jgi:hypothetical protein